MNDKLGIVSRWDFEIVRAGKVIWRGGYYNLVPTAGLNKLLDAAFVTGLATPTWYVGLVATGPTYAAADTMSSHAGWTEDTNYSATTRQAYTPAAPAAGAITNTASKASLTMSAGTTIAGGFLTDSSTKGGTTGTLFGEGSFTAGSQALLAADVLNVTVTVTIASAGSNSFMPIKEEVFGEFHP